MKERLCFLYGPILDPARLESVAPEATFDRIAHLPAHRLAFAPDGAPVVVADDGHTVWGGVFSVPDGRINDLAGASFADPVVTSSWAVDRDGNRLEVALVSAADGGQATPEAVEDMVTGARHWGLPTGWIVGLEDLLDPFEF